TGATMSPVIFARSLSLPSQGRAGCAGVGGTISATGSPNFVTTIGWPVSFTRLSTARQRALNAEMAMVSLAMSRIYHGHVPWSISGRRDTNSLPRSAVCARFSTGLQGERNNNKESGAPFGAPQVRAFSATAGNSGREGDPVIDRVEGVLREYLGRLDLVVPDRAAEVRRARSVR